MRPIKFKAKRIDNGEWVEGDLVLNYIHHKSRASIVNGGGCVWHEVDPQTVCQFTGLYDKDGKDIWEGDILTGGIYRQYHVRWGEDDMAGFNIGDLVRYFKVIGNIHDKEGS